MTTAAMLADSLLRTPLDRIAMPAAGPQPSVFAPFGLTRTIASQDLGDPFDGDMLSGEFGPVRLCRIAAQRHPENRPGRHTSRRGTAFYKLVFQLRGTAQLEQGARRTVLRANQWSIYDVSRPYTMRNLDDLDQLAILLPKRKEFDFAEQLLRAVNDECFELAGMGTVLFNTAQSALDQAQSIGNTCNAELGEMMAELAKLAVLENFRTRPRVSTLETARDRIKGFILRNLSDEDLNVDRIATALSCSKRYLHKVFSDDGKTLTQFIWDTRLERCREDLLDPRRCSHSITQIAFSWGFTNSAHFSRAFRNRFGCSARDCRREFAEAA
ncbi:MAG: helix-turn-helix protein [Sphingomonas bacterium]|jgi:AraC-like DNA-binding protein|nr:helix-turn-helix protein [Sphingomonas bacterium]